MEWMRYLNYTQRADGKNRLHEYDASIVLCKIQKHYKHMLIELELYFNMELVRFAQL